MNYEVKLSPTVKAIFKEAEYHKDNFNSSETSVLHAVLALFYMQFSTDDHDRDEVQEAIDMLGIAEESYGDFITVLSTYLSQNIDVKLDEHLNLAEACALADLFAVDQNVPTLTAPHLMKEILKDRTGVIAHLKDILMNKKEPSAPPSTPFTVPQPSTQPSVCADEEWDPFDNDAEDEFDTVIEETNIADLVAEANSLQAYLLDHVYGQDEAVSALVSGYFNSMVTNNSARKDSRPAATFLFAGAPGVGKTYLAECAAKHLGRPFKRFDMSGFSDKEAPLSFAGCDKVFKAAHPGLVTEFVEKNPNCVILFDEIEKAHRSVIHLFLQILDAGRLKDTYTERDVSFKNAIIIMTTNVGRALYENDDDQFSKTAVSRKVIINALATEKDPTTAAPYFPTAICSRFASGNILLFNPLTAKDLVYIAQRRLMEFCDTFEKNQEIEIHFDKHIGPALLFSEGGKVDARSLKGRADTFISSEIFKWLKFAHARDPVQFTNLLAITIEVDVEDGGEAAWLFQEEENANILLFSERKDVFERILECEGYTFFTASSAEEAKNIIAKNDIHFAVCDILRDRNEETLNIEDSSSAGRQLFDFFVREEIPFYVFTENEMQINVEERQALLEQKAHGFFECYVLTDVEELLSEINYEVSCENKLLRLARANKVLTFDCNYEWADDELGLISVTNLRISPAIDAEDKKDIAPTDVSNVTFDQIIGAEDVKDELRSFISFLRNPKEYAHYGIPAPKGILLYGPPGTGKTMLAKALAQEAGAAFIATEGNMFLKSAYGQAGECIHSVFKKARKYAPCILFIDEIDVIAMDRKASGSLAVNDALNALLNEMDGFSTNPNKPVFVLAATNFDVSFGKKSALDPAVLRRFDRRIFVDLPDRNERKLFMRERLSRSRQQLDDAILDNFAARAVGMSLAELSSIVDFALRSMLRMGESTLTTERLNEAFETFCYGEAHEQNEAAALQIALHEAGHAFVSWSLGEKPSYITISGRGSFGGYMQTEAESSVLLTASKLKSKICTSLAGRAAEVVFFGDNEGVSTGAAGDLKVATAIALEMITEFGMSQEHGLVTTNRQTPDAHAFKLCNDILDEQFENAVNLIKQNKEKVLHLAEELVEKNHLLGHEVEALFKN